MTSPQTRIDAACAGTEPRTRERNKALAGIKWRLRYGLLYAGLHGFKCVLVSADDQRCQIFDGRDNQDLKARFYDMDAGCKFEVELCDAV